MKCVELAETSPPTAVKDAFRRFKEIPAQSAFEEFAKRLENQRRGYSSETPRKNVGDRVATLGSDGMKVSLAIDKNAEKKAVRDLFVEHEGKKKLCVDVPTTCIYDVDY
ncbi:Hypothetical predicted protein, partial [Paramuricea clavata]